jgi:hypothetical protein
MSDSRSEDLLMPALTAARLALQRLDEDDVPAALRKVAASSSRRLPPPMRRRLLDELDGDTWLRAEALEMLDDAAGGSEAANRASRLFLERPPSWWVELGAIAAEREASAAATGQARDAAAVADLEAKLARARRTAKEQKRELLAERDAARADAKAWRERAAELEPIAEEDAARRAVAADRRIAELEGVVAAMRRDLDRATSEASSAQEMLRRVRRDLAEADRQAVSAAAGPGLGFTDPVEFAKHLDRIAAAGTRPAMGASDTAVAAAAPLRLEPGVRPDDPAAVDWLIAQEDVTVLVDGYNVAHQLVEGELDPATARTLLNQELHRLGAAAAGPMHLLVVYDSTTGEASHDLKGPPGVAIRFAPADGSADDEIIALAGRGRVVVISSDRRVREGAEANGAVALWAEALAGWLRSRR